VLLFSLILDTTTNESAKTSFTAKILVKTNNENNRNFCISDNYAYLLFRIFVDY
jgi:hypothetical protein